MKLGFAVWTVVGFAAVGCGTHTRNFATAAAGSAGKDGAGDAGAAGEGGGSGGSAGQAGAESEAGAAGMAGASDQTEACDGLECNTPPDSACKDANTRTSYDPSGTCSAGSCDYVETDIDCEGDTPKCKDLAMGSRCVACLANSDCSNGGTCSSANACVCSPRFNGAHCEFQVFRGLGPLMGDVASSMTGISHDGSVVVGVSTPANYVPAHAFRAVNGGAPQPIPAPGSVMGAGGGCTPKAVDASGAVLLDCEGQSFLYTTAAGAVAIGLPANGYIADISSSGGVMVGSSGVQALRKVGATNTFFDSLQMGGMPVKFAATNGDGSVAVGWEGGIAIRWTAATGLVALATLSGVNNYQANDVSADGKVVVGTGDPNLNGVPIKWSGPAQTPTALGLYGRAFATNFDGSVTAGDSGPDGGFAMIWDSTGAHKVLELLTAIGTPDLSGWNLRIVQGISDDGKFLVGSGGDPSNVNSGWVAHLP